MYLKNIATPKRLLRNYELLVKVFDGYTSKVDVMRNNLSSLVSTWEWDYTLSGFSSEGLNTEETLHIFSVSKPANFAHDSNNVMYFSVYNVSYLGTSYLGEITTPEDTVSDDFDRVFSWGYDDSKIYIYVPTSGLAEEKYMLWLPQSYTEEEGNLFFNKIHSFVIDYKHTT